MAGNTNWLASAFSSLAAAQCSPNTYVGKSCYLKNIGPPEKQQAGGSRTPAKQPTTLPGPRCEGSALVYLLPPSPLADRAEGCPCPLRRTFQELAEVKVVLRDHVRYHLLVEAYDLQQDGFQKNGFCIV